MRISNRWLGTLGCALLLLVLQGCETRSISDSGYRTGYGRGDANPFYHGELTEFEVLGVERGAGVAEGDIARALEDYKPITLSKGASVMLIQSGAPIPDQAMVEALSHSYRVGIFGGQPPRAPTQDAGRPEPASSYATTLRVAAARGGYEKLLVYWGVLESGQENLSTRTVSWVPVVGWYLPDQRQRMRIRLKLALVDVKTGNWDLFAPEPIEDRAISSMLNREKADQGQVELLKRKAYPAAVRALEARYAQR